MTQTKFDTEYFIVENSETNLPYFGGFKLTNFTYEEELSEWRLMDFNEGDRFHMTSIDGSKELPLGIKKWQVYNDRYLGKNDTRSVSIGTNNLHF